MSFNPSGAALFSLYAGTIPSNSFIAYQVNQDAQLDAYLVQITGSPRALFTVTEPSGNYNLALISGANQSFSFTNGVASFRSPNFSISGLGTPNTGGLLNVAFTSERGGVNIQSYGDTSEPHLRLRSQTSYPSFTDYKITLGDSFVTEDIFSQEIVHNLPGNMAVFCANAFNSATWGTSIAGASSSSAGAQTPNQVIGSTFVQWNGVGICKRNLTILPKYLEVGGTVDISDAYEDIGGEGSIVLRNTEDAPSAPHSAGAIWYGYLGTDNKNHLGIINQDGTSCELYPGILSTNRVTYSSDAYIPVTGSRSLTDNDNGKILCTSTGNYLLTFPNTLTKPFKCQFLGEGTGLVRVTGDGTSVIRNFSNQYRSAGQYSVSYLECRSGNNVIFYGSTQL